ncbi:hypothetical protein [Lactiplantibacillus modestisalitolerans]|uniref:DUF2334 domain-containing protein n=1 Tax=Lactiplantibacillus modestisalitolerans TaxID=1457219 RepID=A0ABV5WQH2_9LACO|nr:hypothetical protein [Lactiplantibacillus modestisalitolerans]
MRSLRKIIMLLVVLVAGTLLGGRVAQAQTTRVLLVYDSQNVANNGERKVAAMQRILTSLKLTVKTQAAADYQAGTLRAYQGVVTMINWPQVGLENAAFLRDRSQFNGVQLHVGANLTSAEARHLGATPVKLYHQQLILQNRQKTVQQLLPFSDTMTVLRDLPTGTRVAGYLQSQGQPKQRYPYGSVTGKFGYLPYFKTDGYSLMMATQTIAQLFGRQGHYQPLLTITKVTPYSNLALLDQLSRYLAHQGIPFAVSTTTVGENGHFKAFKRFAKTLRLVENRGGVIFLKTPVAGGVTAKSGQTLNQLMDSYVIQLAQNQVYPVGISTSIFWNQDRLYRQYGLKRTNQILWLPNPAELNYAAQDNQGARFDHNLYGVAASSFATVQSGPALGKLGLDFALPTALTFTMPNSSRSLANFKRRVQQLNYEWADPAQQMAATHLTGGSTTVAYRHGNYFLNGMATTVTNQTIETAKLDAIKPAENWMNRFFSIQGNFLLIFFAVTVVIFAAFILLGRRIYLNKFKRHK